MKKEMNNRNTVKNYVSIVMAILLLALVFMPTVQAKDENKGVVSFIIEEHYSTPACLDTLFKGPLTIKMEYKPEIVFPKEKILPNEAKNVEISLKDKKASLKIVMPALSIFDIDLPPKQINLDIGLIGEIEIPLFKYDVALADASARLVINASVVGDVAIKNHTSTQGKIITQLVWQKSQTKEVKINSTGYSIGDSIDVCLLNLKYKLSFEIVVSVEVFRGVMGLEKEKEIVQQQLMEITGQSDSLVGNVQVVSWIYYHTKDMQVGIFVIIAAIVIFVRIRE